MKFLITAGPTREFIDPARFISNPSTGKMGFAIAKSALKHGHKVTLVHGPVYGQTPAGSKNIPVISAEDMKKAVFKNAEHADVVIMAAAVSDYRPEKYNPSKIKKTSEKITLKLVKNPDILKELGRIKASADFAVPKKKNEISKFNYLLIGFAAETDNALENAKKKLKEKNLDVIVLNQINKKGAGFGSDSNIVTIISADKSHLHLPKMDKSKVGDIIVSMAEKMRKSKKQ